MIYFLENNQISSILICKIFMFVSLLQSFPLQAQIPVQSIRGQVTDQTGFPLPGVNVVVLDHDPVLGTITDPEGNFSLQDVPVGRHTLRFSSIGYETVYSYNLIVTSARQLVLEIVLAESVTELDEVLIRPDINKDQPINRMAMASARMLSMEEASRFAGGFDDPARLAGAFAGVTGNMEDNAMVIRGNAPKGVLWLMEGIEIPAPNHFADIITLGGGGISALSSRMIANSDFFTGAFPAEYGNALSGVVDLRLRNGNNQNHQHAVQLGTIGADIASEGPLPGVSNASYLFNYRMSTFSLVAPLLPEDAGNIRYQNLSFKLNLPLQGRGSLSIWGIGANDRSGGDADENPENWIYDWDREKVFPVTRFGAMGIRSQNILGARTRLTTSFAASGSGVDWDLFRYTDNGQTLAPFESVNSGSWRLTGKSVLDHRFSAVHSNRSGFIVNRIAYNQNIQQTPLLGTPLHTYADESGHNYLYQAFSQSHFNLGAFSFTGGMHFKYFGLTEASSAEPRLGLQYETGASRYSIAFGRHSIAEPLNVYFGHPENLKLDLAKADHLVLGYSRMISADIRLNIETYYQWLFNIPVVPNSYFSTLNMELDWFVNQKMVNEGKGRNYGIELTLERYFSQGWYSLITGSVFNSEYTDGKGIWRNTRFNRGYAFALLGGKEWEFRRGNKVSMLGINATLNLMGGKRMSPVNEELSHEQRRVVLDQSQAFSLSHPSVVWGDIAFSYRRLGPRINSVWSLQIFNITGYEEFYGYKYNLRYGTIDEDRAMIILPNLNYTIEF